MFYNLKLIISLKIYFTNISAYKCNYMLKKFLFFVISVRVQKKALLIKAEKTLKTVGNLLTMQLSEQ